MLNRDLSAILLTQETSNNGSCLITKSVPGNIVGDCQEDQRVEGNFEARIRLLGGEEGVWLRCGHFDVGKKSVRLSAARRDTKVAITGVMQSRTELF